MKKFLFLALCGLTLVAAASLGANPLKEDPEHQGPGFTGELDFRQLGNAPEGAVGTIVYDTGTFTGVGNIPAIADNFSFGNVFGPCPLPFTVTDLSMFMAIVDSLTTGSGNVFATVFGPLNTAGTNASPITSPLVALNANAFNNVSVSVQFTGTGSSSFLAGVWNPTAGTTAGPTPCANDCVGFDSAGTVAGNGFNGFALEDLNGGNFNAITNANAIYRVSGPNVPVELMSFTIDED
jgi:hypothetical protein